METHVEETVSVDKIKVEIDINAYRILIDMKQQLRRKGISNTTYSEAIREMERIIKECEKVSAGGKVSGSQLPTTKDVGFLRGEL